MARSEFRRHASSGPPREEIIEPSEEPTEPTEEVRWEAQMWDPRTFTTIIPPDPPPDPPEETQFEATQYELNRAVDTLDDLEFWHGTGNRTLRTLLFPDPLGAIERAWRFHEILTVPIPDDDEEEEGSRDSGDEKAMEELNKLAEESKKLQEGIKKRVEEIAELTAENSELEAQLPTEKDELTRAVRRNQRAVQARIAQIGSELDQAEDDLKLKNMRLRKIRTSAWAKLKALKMGRSTLLGLLDVSGPMSEFITNSDAQKYWRQGLSRLNDEDRTVAERVNGARIAFFGQKGGAQFGGSEVTGLVGKLYDESYSVALVSIGPAEAFSSWLEKVLVAKEKELRDQEESGE